MRRIDSSRRTAGPVCRVIGAELGDPTQSGTGDAVALRW